MPIEVLQSQLEAACSRRFFTASKEDVGLSRSEVRRVMQSLSDTEVVEIS